MRHWESIKPPARDDLALNALLSTGDPLGGIVVWVARIGKGIVIAAALSVFDGCQSVGPIAIDAGRDRYNSIIQSTSKQQAFANIIRVHNNEPTSFMDVTEVDATQTFSGTVSGGVTGIGSKPGTYGTLGSVTPGVSYSEAPLIRYVPLVGQGLVEQLVAPINTDALASLYDSSWPVMPLLDLSTSYLTLDYDEEGAALNLIGELDYNERLELVSTKSQLTKPKEASNGAGKQSGTDNNNQQSKKTTTSASTDDSLVIYFMPFHPHALPLDPSEKMKCLHDQMLWNQPVRLYQYTQTSPPQSMTCGAPNITSIELRTLSVTKKGVQLKYTVPLMRTYSALGVLRNAAQPPNPRIEFVPLDDYQRITSYRWNDWRIDSNLSFYTLLPGEPHEDNESPNHESRAEKQRDKAELKTEDTKIRLWLEKTDPPVPYVYPLPYLYPRPGKSDDDFVKYNHRLWQLRRYMLIIKSDGAPPPNAYVSYFDRGFWYYIDGDDTISQKNFNLIALFMTVMAIPPTNAPLTTAITVGGG